MNQINYNDDVLIDVTDKLEIDETIHKINIINECPPDIYFEKIKIKFNEALIKYLNNIKNDPMFYEHVYKQFFILWKKIARENQNISLFSLLTFLSQKEAYNIKRTIFDNLTNENLKNSVYLRFINDFIGF
jgi:hypothetical protein